ncbi:MAG: glycoside hydrolase family 99-like domain-containing protein [Anaerolineae bacterium]|nr:glycoside hydrolase family 99-like domain-containing protein [Anaerolineae bacterium]
MTLRKLLPMLWLLLIVLISVIPYQPAQAQDDDSVERPLLLAHYMPWYQTPDVSGDWGWHWTMNHVDPSMQTENGKPEIASHYMPLTGPYDSQDDALLEYQVLLMKLSGIDGVIVDWYGFEDYLDYGLLNAATHKLFDHVQRAGLSFVICYEDATVRNMIDGGYLNSDDALTHGAEVMQYLQENWFEDDAYLKVEGQPLLFVFGPQYFRDPANWEVMAADLDTPPALVTLDGHMDWAALAGYPWPPMSMAGGIELAPAVLTSYLELFYRNAGRGDYVVGSAFPSFHDIYEEAGERSSYGYIDPQDGETLRMTLLLALDADSNIIQLVTWNDYGEGTMIEPTEETGYQYLEIVQETRQSLDSEDFQFTADDLRLPLQLFNLRKAHADNAEAQTQLDEVFDAIIAGDLDTARAILESL